MAFLAFLFSINGRVRRREFFLSVLVLAALFANVLAGVHDTALRQHVYANTATDAYIVNLLTHSDTHHALFALLVVIAYTICAKRFHDRNRSGWWNLMVLVPVIGWAWMTVELLIMPGSPGDNRYGPHPTFTPSKTSEPLNL